MLALYSRQISGATPNPYFQRFSAISNLEDATLLLVCRLDAPTAATVRGMIVDAIATEKSGLWGRAYVDGGHNTGAGLEVGDQWLTEITGQLHKAGIPVVYDDTPGLFPYAYPMTDCALYYGWYAGNVVGPFTRPDFRFVRGAIAVHIHSFSARTLRDPNANWVAPLASKARPRVWVTFTSRTWNSLRTSISLTIGCCMVSHLPRAPTCRSERSPGCR